MVAQAARKFRRWHFAVLWLVLATALIAWNFSFFLRRTLRSRRFRGQRLQIASEFVATVITPAALCNTGETSTSVFDFADSVALRDRGVSKDERRLGFGFRRVRFRELPLP